MGVFFGTDGIRGKFGEDLSLSLAQSVGFSLGLQKQNVKVLIGRDTRKSGSLITLAFSCGILNAGGNVVDVGVCPTAGISYLTALHKFDYGVIISASHNPAEFNGIKIVDSSGKKLDENAELKIEKMLLKRSDTPLENVGEYLYKPKLVRDYIKFLKSNLKVDLGGKKIVIDSANGAASHIIREVFRGSGAKISFISARPNGLNINKKCGALNTKKLQKTVLKNNADIGFAYDGDSDRLIAVDEKGKVVSGDVLVYLFAKFYMMQGKLKKKTVVGTRHTNMGVENTLKNEGISLIRADIGDKYVSAKLIENGLLIGGEQSGHIIVRDLLCTGDGILNSILVCNIMSYFGKSMSTLCNVPLYIQENINIEVKDKLKVINSEKLSKQTEVCEKKLGCVGRLMIRLSGTEPYIRIMVESQDAATSKKIAKEIAEVVRQIDSET